VSSSLTYAVSVDEQRRQDRRTWAVMYLGILAVSAVLGLVAMTSAPNPFSLPLTMLLIASVLVVVKPVAGPYLIAFFAVMSDGVINPWYPFTFGLSNQDSILFVTDSLTVSPLEILVVLTAMGWLIHLLFDRRSAVLVRGALWRPMAVFTGFVLWGFVVGLGTGGNRYVAIWEVRPILLLPVFYVLVTNLFTTRRQYVRLGGAFLLALVVHSVLALQTLSTLSAAERKSLESLVAHPAAVQLSVVLFVALASWMIKGVPASLRWCSLAAAIPVGWVWLVSQRRAAVIGFAFSIIVFGMLLTKLNRRLFRKVAPVFIVVCVGYIGAFWNTQGTAGFPAQAVKAVISPNSISQDDRDSDIYRNIENYDISVTIRAKPITGLGFGQKFYRPINLPDISFFEFYEYIPHNAILWIWMEMGVGGFIAMLYLFASAIRVGVGGVLKLMTGVDALLVMTGVAYLSMFVVFAYVDMAWDPATMITVAIAMALCDRFWRVPAPQDGPRPTTRRRVPVAPPTGVAAPAAAAA
jgi:O-Antigen ligase